MSKARSASNSRLRVTWPALPVPVVADPGWPLQRQISKGPGARETGPRITRKAPEAGTYDKPRLLFARLPCVAAVIARMRCDAIDESRPVCRQTLAIVQFPERAWAQVIAAQVGALSHRP